MTRAEAKKAAEVMMAYADGKDIEYKSNDTMDDEWLGYDDHFLPKFNWKNNTYRPFKNKEECWAEMQKHQPFGWVKKTNSDAYIGDLYTLVQHISDRMDYMGYFAEYTFTDGTPFGIKEE